MTTMRKVLLIGTVLLMAACGSRPSADVEKVEICTEVGDFGMLVNGLRNEFNEYFDSKFTRI